jgi:hypothetical protein
MNLSWNLFRSLGICRGEDVSALKISAFGESSHVKQNPCTAACDLIPPDEFPTIVDHVLKSPLLLAKFLMVSAIRYLQVKNSSEGHNSSQLDLIPREFVNAMIVF